MKAKIFIGSSTESINVATRIKNYFDVTYECTIWNDHFFQLNESTYETLIRKSAAYDYAIFVGGTDDLVIRKSNHKKKNAVRDNVYFELGLYTGILSKNRAFFFIDENVGLASDLLGITLIRYKNEADVDRGCQQVMELIEDEEKINRISMLPSTSLALNYYTNFLNPLGNQISTCNFLKFKGTRQRVQTQSLQVVIPDNCNMDWKIWANEFYTFHHCSDTEIHGEPRNFSVKFDTDALLSSHELKIWDVPQVLNASFRAVELVVGKDHIGTTDIVIGMKEKETLNFIKTLNNLIKENPILQQRVRIIRISNYDATI